MLNNQTQNLSAHPSAAVGRQNQCKFSTSLQFSHSSPCCNLKAWRGGKGCVASFLAFPSASSLVCSAIFSEAEGVMGGKSSEKVFLYCCRSETGFPGLQNVFKTTSVGQALSFCRFFAGSPGVPYSWESLTVLLKDTCTSTSKWPLKHLLVLETCTSPPLSIISLAATHACIQKYASWIIFQASSGCSSVLFPKHTMFLSGLFESFFCQSLKDVEFTPRNPFPFSLYLRLFNPFMSQLNETPLQPGISL